MFSSSERNDLEIFGRFARFVELYWHDPNSVERFLEDEFSSEELEAKNAGNRAAELIIDQRTLIDLADVNSRLQPTLDAFPPIEADEITFEWWCRIIEDGHAGRLQSIAEGIREHSDDPQWKVKSNEEILFWMYNNFRKQAADEARRPDFHVLFTQDFASKLDSMVEKVNGLGELACYEIVSDSVRGLLREAHYCFLHGLEKAVAITCGAALEQALEEVIPHEGNWKLDQLLEEAKEKSLLSEEEWGMADDVREFRNLAAARSEGVFASL